MTILKGDVYKFETLGEFMYELDVDMVELLEAVDMGEEAYEEYCEIADDEGDWSPAASLSDVPDDFLEEYKYEVDLHSSIRSVLEQRDSEYIHLYDYPIHTVVDLN